MGERDKGEKVKSTEKNTRKKKDKQNAKSCTYLNFLFKNKFICIHLILFLHFYFFFTTGIAFFEVFNT